MRRKPTTEPLDADKIKEAADQWFAAFSLVRAAHPRADVEAQIAMTEWALKT